MITHDPKRKSFRAANAAMAINRSVALTPEQEFLSNLKTIPVVARQ
jgi:hypothetical protein